ncbi:hypothetical protein JDV02_007283 [Purpureocillium takamizusanense]|uniref:Uncharacterized protein n=1 Tax=Purpureocillium takamizusanense TaxID=2060973 RepID=A0A9Q8QLE2_9HYPO|nr:uncharacterized protein JDV02_007283 [Purpureocillium takamizusanense]UNI21281.1 hypothetical protein JDV02_007283 [Purpureocillium takamizusanense]
MKYIALLAGLASLAAALPSPQAAHQQLKRVHRRHLSHGGRASSFNHKDDRVTAAGLGMLKTTKHTSYSDNWAGAVQTDSGFTKVVGTITVPKVSSGGDAHAAAAAWVGIDGDSCDRAILQTGIDFYADGSFDAWYEWIPDGSFAFSDFGMSVGDKIRMMVEARSSTSGVATLENLSTGAKASHDFTNPPSKLCEENAEWIVEDFVTDGKLVPFADFGSITFTDARAEGSSGTVTPAGAEIYDIVADDKVVTDCSTNGDDLTCDYTG